MTTVEQIDQDLNASLRAGETDRIAILRLLKSSLANERIKLGHELSEAEVTKLLSKEAKQRRDSIKAYEDGHRVDLAAGEQAELAVIESYLPKALTEDELKELVDQAISETGVTEIKQMGAVMARVIQKAEGRADGAVVAQLVRQRLS